MQVTALDQITGSALIVWLLQLLKNAKWFPFLTAETQKLNRFVAVAASGLLAVGIHVTYAKTAGVLTITGLTVPGVLYGLWHWLNSYATQEVIFRATVKAASLSNGGPK